ncbi:hypothetical protein [Methylophaga nitratireducenticrescens]|uniref:Uncharacterized protein n=1 Tax=Methylophaga nitratireducenticrescens TaxID=754476 RepID=I1XM69_METNJ|nr:hypothetical protein [Methylophaga nitratireducenticrescens]
MMNKSKTRDWLVLKLECDISENYFARGSVDFEIDDFEELDLRAIATASPGRGFLFRNRI